MTQTQRPELFSQGIALVVGGSGGVGRAIALSLAEAGSDVAITWRSNEAPALEVADKIRALGRKAEVVQLDLGSYDAVMEVLAKLSKVEGGVHTVVCAAGAAIDQPYISQTDPSAFQKVIQDDLGGFFHLARASIEHLRVSKGSLVAITSAGLYRFPPGDILSVAPKGGIEALVQGIAREEGRFGIRANCVALGVIDAGMFLNLQGNELDQKWLDAARENTPLKRFGKAQEVADAAVFLASTQANYITGQTLRLDGGYSI
jgi:NAD(P)-dependent dehydrogenase (short-subunit alcohol dehydrogenase family)